MHSFVKNLITEWRRLELPFKGENIVIAVSGGADSVSLLLGVHDLVKRNKLDHRIVAAHFNHRLRGKESDADEQFVRELATRLGVELAIGGGDISKDGNLEQNARDARYEFLRQTAKNLNAFAVLTGHTVNDQAETFLLNLIRGSGPDGLSGMRVIRVLESEKVRKGEGEKKTVDEADKSHRLTVSPSPLLLVRPLLTWAKRIDTEAFCHDLSVAYRYDTMNDDTAFKRVQIRKILLPLLEDMNPKIVETLANTAALMQGLADSNEPKNEYTVMDELILKEIKTLSSAELSARVRSWLRRRRGNTRQLQLKHIQAIERLILSAKSGRNAELPGGRVTKKSGKLVYDKNKVEN